MEPKDEVYIRALLLQYKVFRQELMNFTNWFISSTLAISVAWYLIHLEHIIVRGLLLATVAGLLGVVSATHCGNTLESLKGLTTLLNKEMAAGHTTFGYDQGRESTPLRIWATRLIKGFAILVLIDCFLKWPRF